MPTLRQQVDTFCKNSGAKVDASDKLRKQVADLKSELKKVKDHMKSMKAKPGPKAKTKRVKMTDEEKGQRRRERAVTKELEKAKARPPALAEPMLPAAAAVPVPAPSLAPAAPPRGGTRRMRRRKERPTLRW